MPSRAWWYQTNGRDAVGPRPGTPRKSRRAVGPLGSTLLLLAVGALLAVFVVYPVLPETQRSWVANTQIKARQLIPWTSNP